MKIDWKKRLFGGTSRIYVSVDGTGVPICEPSPFSKGPGLRYEIAVSVRLSEIVWVHGPFPCGCFPDLRIFRTGLKHALLPGEKVIADAGYRDVSCAFKGHSDYTAEEGRQKSIVRARHETVNRRLKQFHVVSHRFRHAISLHSACFHAVSNVTQLMIEHGELLFDI